MLTLAVRMARYRFGALVAIAITVLAGAALISSTAVLAESGFRSHLPTGRLVGADVVIAADQTHHVPQDLPIGLPERRLLPGALVDRFARLPGVESAVGDLSFPAAVLDRRGRVVPTAEPGTAGHSWSSVGLLGDAALQGNPPAGQDDIAVDRATADQAQVRPGDRVQVVAAGRQASHLVVAVLDAEPRGLYFADPTAAPLAGRESGPRAGLVDLVALRTTAGAASEVAAAVRRDPAAAGLVVLTGDSRGDAAAPAATAARSTLVLLAGSLSGILLLVVGFVVVGSMAASVHTQRRELAMMRSVGATPAQVRRLAAGQATAVALPALPPGIALGYLIAGRFKDLLTDLGVVPADLPLTPSPMPAVATCLLLVACLQVSGRVAGWRASRLPATEAVALSTSEPRSPSRVRTRAGLLLIAMAGVLSFAPLLTPTPQAAAATSVAGMCAAIGLAVAGPSLVRQSSAALARRLPRRVGTSTWLAVANTAGSPARAAATATALAAAVLFVLTYAFSTTTLLAATSRQLTEATVAQQSITAQAVGGLPDGVLDEVLAQPGIRAVAPVSTTTVLWAHRELGDVTVDASPALVLTPAATGVLDLDVRSGNLADLTGDTVAIGSDAARSRRAPVGGTVRLTLGDGALVVARVVAVYGRDLAFGPVVLSRELAAGHTTTGLDQELMVSTDGTAAAQEHLSSFIGSRAGLALGPVATGGRLGSPPEAGINLVVLAVLLGYLLLGVANKAVVMTARRQGELATLRLIGATPPQIRSVMRREAALLSAAAVGSGLALSAVPLALLGMGFLGRPWAAGPAWLVPVAVAGVVGLALLTVELPTRWVLRRGPTD